MIKLLMFSKASKNLCSIEILIGQPDESKYLMKSLHLSSMSGASVAYDNASLITISQTLDYDISYIKY